MSVTKILFEAYTSCDEEQLAATLQNNFPNMKIRKVFSEKNIQITYKDDEANPITPKQLVPVAAATTGGQMWEAACGLRKFTLGQSSGFFIVTFVQQQNSAPSEWCNENLAKGQSAVPAVERIEVGRSYLIKCESKIEETNPSYQADKQAIEQYLLGQRGTVSSETTLENVPAIVRF